MGDSAKKRAAPLLPQGAAEVPIPSIIYVPGLFHLVRFAYPCLPANSKDRRPKATQSSQGDIRKCRPTFRNLVATTALVPSPVLVPATIAVAIAVAIAIMIAVTIPSIVVVAPAPSRAERKSDYGCRGLA